MHTRLLSLLVAASCTKEDPNIDESDPAVFDDDLGVVCEASPQTLPNPPPVLPSFHRFPTSNGWSAATWDTEAHALTSWMDHPAKNPNPSVESKNRLYDAYWGVRVGNSTTWLNTLEGELRYVPGTGILEIVNQIDEIQITTRVWAPFEDDAERDLLFTAEVINTSSTANSVQIFALVNARPAGEAGGEQVGLSGEGILETSNGTMILHHPLSSPQGFSGAPAGTSNNPWILANGGYDFGSTLENGDDVAVGFQWTLGTLQPTESASRGLALSWADDENPQTRLESMIAGRSASAMLASELENWEAFHSVEPTLTPVDEERFVYEQSTAVLRMAQVRIPGSGYGQLLASLPPGNWNISWPRDAAYAIVALVRTGHVQEARNALHFMLYSDAGHYADWLGLEDYGISLARYYADGTEESDGAWCADGSDAGPNIELDNLGLFLWAWVEYARANPTDPWLTETQPLVQSGIADVLVELVDPNRNLLVPDSSIWERHWHDCFPNGRKRFSYSSLHAAAGLRDYADWSGSVEVLEAGEQLRSGLLRTNDDHGPIRWETPTCPFLASSPEEICEGCGPYDASVIDIINRDVIRPESSLAIGTLDGLSTLRMNNGSPGYLRTDDGTGTINPFPWYDDQEWVVIDLRVAVAFHRVGIATGNESYLANADTLLEWVTAQGVANQGLIAELLSDGDYTPDDDAFGPGTGHDLGSEFQGAVPMAGFGAGAYVLALEELRHEPE